MRYFFVILSLLFLVSCSTVRVTVVKKTCTDHPQLSELATCDEFVK